MRLKKVKRLYFDKGNVAVCGLRGTGKDMLFANITALGKMPYISNMDYHNKNVYIPLDFNKLDVKNNYKNLISENIVPYNYPYPDKCDIFLSDAGIYFPCQYNEQLNKEYDKMPVFQALSRHLGDCNFHYNSQNLNRVWDKIREQADLYIMCNWCYNFNIPILRHLPFFNKLVIQKITFYDKYDSAVNRVKPYVPIRPSLFAVGSSRAMYKSQNLVAKQKFNEEHGTVKTRLLIYHNNSKYDTRLFKSILGGGLFAKN